MALTGRERRELREIEQTLRVSDPALAGLLTSAAERAIRRARSAAAAIVTVSALLLIGGLILRDADLIISGCLVLLAMPPTVWLIIAVGGRET